MSRSFLSFFNNFSKLLILSLILLSVLAACIHVQPILSADLASSELVFSEEAENALFNISNTGGGTLAWTATLSEFSGSANAQNQWVELLVFSGQLGKSQSQAIALKRSIMPPGTYTAVLTFSYPYNGATVTKSFQVKAVVPDKPIIKIDSPFNSLDIAAGHTSFYIQNGSFSNKILNWRFDNLPNWLIADKTSGTLTAGQEQLVRFSLKAGINPANYAVDLGITASEAARKTQKVIANYQGCVDQAASTNLSPQAVLPIDPPDAKYVSGQVLVRFKDLSERDAIIAAYPQLGLVLFEDGQGYVADVFSTLGEPAEVAVLLNQDVRIENAQPNYYLKLLTHDFDYPEDTFFGQQWYLQNYGVAEGWELINVRKQMSQDPIIVAVIDNGTDTGHVDLGSNLVPGCDFFGNAQGTADNDPRNPNQSLKHGTHVAGIVAAVSDNNQGTVGVSYLANVKVQPIKVFSSQDSASVSSAVNGIRWAAGLPVPNVKANPTPADILNFSVGKPVDTSPDATFDKELHKAVADVVAAGKLFVAASGNQNFETGNGLYSPANSPDAIAVGSIDSDLRRSSFSKFDSSGARTVDVVAPGGILVTGNPPKCNSSSLGILNTFPNNAYGCQSGTSMATPYVSGVLALIWAQNPDWDAAKVKQRLYDSVLFDASWAGKANEYGRGLTCLDRALGADSLCARD